MNIVTWVASLGDRSNHEERHSETARVFESVLCKFFSHTRFNRSLTPSEAEQSFSIYFHCYSNNNSLWEYSNYIRIPDSPQEYPHIDHTFFTFSQRPIGQEDSLNTLIEYKGSPIGVLSLDEQILWASAWTNMRGHDDHIQHILSFLHEEGYLIETSPKIHSKNQKEEKINFSISVGGDPEFELVNSCGEITNASNACLDIEVSHGNIGVDGSGDQVELRPSPGSPEEVVENVRNLLRLFGERHGEVYRLAASSDEYPCGGHIHIGVEPLPNEDYFSKLASILDDFIGYPSKRLNGPAREECEYGEIHDWREQPHGMEYRTPPSTVWRNPELSRVVLKLTFNIAHKLANECVVEYESPIMRNPSSLVEVGGLTEEEALFFITECQKKPPFYKESLLAAWGITEPEFRHKITISFSDDWSYGVSMKLRSIIEKVSVSKSITVCFYGLNQIRGDVFTFNVPGKGIIPHPDKSLGTYNFGFSKRFRSSYRSPEEIKLVADSVITMLTDLLKKGAQSEHPSSDAEEAAMIETLRPIPSEMEEDPSLPLYRYHRFYYNHDLWEQSYLERSLDRSSPDHWLLSSDFENTAGKHEDPSDE